ncbi:MAG: hypothetical protein LBP62_03520 [Clostridiales bacterium]|nr:hypothetical protein [Clostridiales bacterium]
MERNLRCFGDCIRVVFELLKDGFSIEYKWFWIVKGGFWVAERRFGKCEEAVFGLRKGGLESVKKRFLNCGMVVWKV